MAKELRAATATQYKIIEEYERVHNIILNYTGAAIIEQLTNGAKTIKDLTSKLGVVPKTIRYWLENKLNGAVKKVPNLNDMRSHYYHLEPAYEPMVLKKGEEK